jgi:MoaA/NifB/PqqE/SkfB family radical SAM enzyme
MMPMPVRRTLRRWNRLYRETRVVAQALREKDHPVFAHVVVTRRCNLACAYCSEFDDHSKPVPTEELLKRIDKLAALGTTTVTITGGETLLHPELEQVIARIRSYRMIAVMITNGYLLSVDRIKSLNKAGLDRMQISIDNIEPDDVSMKSLRILDLRLRWLAEHAEFPVHIHSVVGAGTSKPADVIQIQSRARQLGHLSTAGIVHDATGHILPIDEESRRVLKQVEGSTKSAFSFARHNPWRAKLLAGKPNDWHCPAGGRHLYICEFGLVHYCMSQRGYPAIPLEQYTIEDCIREAKKPKACAPYCTIFCVHRIAWVDRLRENPSQALTELFPPQEGSDQPAIPAPVRALTALFAAPKPGSKPSGATLAFRKAAMRLLKIS